MGSTEHYESIENNSLNHVSR